ncbi:MAG: hypothetical protein E4H36_09630 [Spirochaetales bacterium]|nr:MAG: hypothetical protein E4H36_09630 [Spirochaetales bacterium]
MMSKYFSRVGLVLFVLLLFVACATAVAEGPHEAGPNTTVHTFEVLVMAPKDIGGIPVIVDWLPMKKIDYTAANQKIEPVYDINLDIHMGNGKEFNVLNDNGKIGDPIIVYLTYTENDRKKNPESKVKIYVLDDNTNGQWVEVPRGIPVEKIDKTIGAIFDGIITEKGKKYLKLSIYRWPSNDRQVGHNG